MSAPPPDAYVERRGTATAPHLLGSVEFRVGGPKVDSYLAWGLCNAAAMFRRPSRRPAFACLAIAAVFATGACEPAVPSLIVDYKTTTVARLTTDGTDFYGFTSTPGGMIASAPPANTGSNLRMVGFKKASPSSTNQESCATWTEGNTGTAQPGVALRIDATPGRVRAITVTNNILFGARWKFNIHLGDSAAKANMVIAQTLTVNWANTPLPWRFCARAEGPLITMKVWPVTDAAEPMWSDPAYTATATVPQAWVYPGRPGWYAGHLAAGQRIVYTGLATGQLPPT